MTATVRPAAPKRPASTRRRASGPIPARRRGSDPVETLYRRPGFLLRRANQIAESMFVEEFDEFDLTPAQCGALVIAEARPGLDQRGLGLAMGFDRATIGEILKKLEGRGLIDRTPSTTDARRLLIAITPAGTEMLRRALPRLDRAQDRLFASYTARERRLLLSLLLQLCETFNAATRVPLVRPPVPSTR